MNRWDSKGPFKPLHVMNPTRLAFIAPLFVTFRTHDRRSWLGSVPKWFVGGLSSETVSALLPSPPLRRWVAGVVPLHVMNPTRLAFIRSTLCRHFGKDPNSARPFEGLKIVDVGCGGGILSEPLARMGATVTGVDAVEKNIKIACIHAVWSFSYDLDPMTSTIEYCCTTAEKLVEEDRKFDAVIALEVIEHVANPAEFCKSLAALTVPDGATIISTINRSMRSYAAAIVAAEYLLHWLPKGTHEWSSFLTPEELVLILQRANITVREMAGFVYSPLTGRWSLSDDIRVNFIAFGTKNCQ
ncbi:ubiquinone biosynthesis o-methyltransferase [Quercus suber]|uniref:Ubiquinone biosynthesis O-methyltransferase, mitochondrial n=1 Tax=Quercus suber TaxID=58331 RepID=A0AAW0LZV8_QUESU